MAVPVAGNVQAAAIAGMFSSVVIHLLTANGVNVPTDTADGITALVTLLTAHLCDVYTANTKPPGAA